MKLLKNALNVAALTAVFTFAGLGLTHDANATDALSANQQMDSANTITEAEYAEMLAIPIPLHFGIHDGNTWYVLCPGCGGHTGIVAYFGSYRTIWIPIPIPFLPF